MSISNFLTLEVISYLINLTSFNNPEPIMKSLFFSLIILVPGIPMLAQESMQKVMEQRARELVRVIGLNSKDEWKKFIEENYSKALIDRPTQAKVSTNDSDRPATSSETKSAGNIEAKAAMFGRLHDDFGGSKITSIKSSGENLEMVMDNGELSGKFMLRFLKEKPYLIDGVGIEVGDVKR